MISNGYRQDIEVLLSEKDNIQFQEILIDYKIDNDYLILETKQVINPWTFDLMIGYRLQLSNKTLEHMLLLIFL